MEKPLSEAEVAEHKGGSWTTIAGGDEEWEDDFEGEGGYEDGGHHDDDFHDDEGGYDDGDYHEGEYDEYEGAEEGEYAPYDESYVDESGDYVDEGVEDGGYDDAADYEGHYEGDGDEYYDDDFDDTVEEPSVDAGHGHEGGKAEDLASSLGTASLARLEEETAALMHTDSKSGKGEEEEDDDDVEVDAGEEEEEEETKSGADGGQSAPPPPPAAVDSGASQQAPPPPPPPPPLAATSSDAPAGKLAEAEGEALGKSGDDGAAESSGKKSDEAGGDDVVGAAAAADGDEFGEESLMTAGGPPLSPSSAAAAVGKKKKMKKTKKKKKRSKKKGKLVATPGAGPAMEHARTLNELGALRDMVGDLETRLVAKQRTVHSLRRKLDRLTARASKVTPLRLEATTPEGKVAELEQLLFNKSAELVAAGEKNHALGRKLEKRSEAEARMLDDMHASRLLLIESMTGGGAGGADAAMFKNVPLTELITIKLRALSGSLVGEKLLSKATRAIARGQVGVDSSGVGKEEGAGEEAGEEAGESGDASAAGGDGSAHEAKEGVGADLDGDGRISAEESAVFAAMQDELDALRAEGARLRKRLAGMQSVHTEVAALQGTVRALKARNLRLTERVRVEKKARAKAEKAVGKRDSKLTALTAHIQKLMLHLKHEATGKVKLSDGMKKTSSELQSAKETVSRLQRRCATKERAIKELRESSKILEDQLQLMDEKYVELRGKLDWTRTSSQKEVRRAEAEAAQLRMKWALVLSGTSPAEAELRVGRVKKRPGAGKAATATGSSTTRLRSGGKAGGKPGSGTSRPATTPAVPPGRDRALPAPKELPALPMTAGFTSSTSSLPVAVDPAMPWSDAKIGELQASFSTPAL